MELEMEFEMESRARAKQGCGGNCVSLACILPKLSWRRGNAPSALISQCQLGVRVCLCSR